MCDFWKEMYRLFKAAPENSLAKTVCRQQMWDVVKEAQMERRCASQSRRISELERLLADTLLLGR